MPILYGCRKQLIRHLFCDPALAKGLSREITILIDKLKGKKAVNRVCWRSARNAFSVCPNRNSGALRPEGADNIRCFFLETSKIYGYLGA